ncbi:MAG: Hsp20/alpha crystallin family protein [Vulcanimicrobiota bacterium]
MNLIKFEPFNELAGLTDTLERSFLRRKEWNVPVMQLDAIETAEELVIKATVPGASKESFQAEFEDGVLSIKAEVKADETLENARYHLRERTFGKVSRTLRIPFHVEADQTRAEFENGVLTLTLPKATSARKRVIEIQ